MSEEQSKEQAQEDLAENSGAVTSGKTRKLAAVIAVITLVAIVGIILAVLLVNGKKKKSAPHDVEAEEKIADEVRDIAASDYEESKEVAIESADLGRYFTDHKTKHAEMVADKAVEVAEAISEAVYAGDAGKETGGDHVPLSGDINWETLIGAALAHDTGMSGVGYCIVYEKDAEGNTLKDENGQKVYAKTSDGLCKMEAIDPEDFVTVRASHSLNSAYIMLTERESYKNAGFSDEDIDKMAAECMAHSKSNSGVTNLNSVKSWNDCFDRLDSLVAAHNKDHPDKPISFDRTPFEKDADKLSILASETLALRVGDVSRDSGPDAEAQSGEAVHVDTSTVNNKGGSIEAETEPAIITIGDAGNPITDTKNKQVHIGEQNISDNHTVYEDGKIVHKITVVNGCTGPKCTQQAIEDHLGEFYSARDESFTVEILFTEFNDEDDFFKNSYNSFRDSMAASYSSITIVYPWDK